jgi:hypothetical protein
LKRDEKLKNFWEGLAEEWLRLGLEKPRQRRRAKLANEPLVFLLRHTVGRSSYLHKAIAVLARWN